MRTDFYCQCDAGSNDKRARLYRRRRRSGRIPQVRRIGSCRRAVCPFVHGHDANYFQIEGGCERISAGSRLQRRLAHRLRMQHLLIADSVANALDVIRTGLCCSVDHGTDFIQIVQCNSHDVQRRVAKVRA